MARDYDEVNPRPEALIESLRAFGYTTPTAIADLVDNSITARASQVEIDFRWDGQQSWVRIADNGEGMGEARLTEAMTLGSQSPLEDRSPRDLGRFGLGLKTASLSQCRCLTVQSSREGRSAIRCWDLDFVQKERKWALLRRPSTPEAVGILHHRPEWPSSTVVVWERLDRIVGKEPRGDRNAESHFLAKIALVEEHLGMVFHRFLARPNPLRISINAIPVKAWDPFLTSKIPLTQQQPEEEFGHGANLVKVQPYVLPHESKLTTQEHDRARGPKGWNAQQGFYIYRNQRMISAGDWLGFFRQEEHYKLARIRLDILNSADHSWRIDVRKAHAIPPDEFKAELRRVAEATRKQAEEAYRTRGHVSKRKNAPPDTYMWLELRANGKIFYRINRDHPMISHALSQDQIPHADVTSLLRAIEETMPGHLVIARFSENAEALSMPFERHPEELDRMAIEVARLLMSAGVGVDEARRRLLTMEPFQYYPDAINRLSIWISGVDVK